MWERFMVTFQSNTQISREEAIITQLSSIQNSLKIQEKFWGKVEQILALLLQYWLKVNVVYIIVVNSIIIKNMMWDCSLVLRTSLYDEPPPQDKFPMHKIKSSLGNIHNIQPQKTYIKEVETNKRCHTETQITKDLKKKKSLKSRHYSPVNTNIKAEHQQSILTNVQLKNLPNEFVSPPHITPIILPTKYPQHQTFKSNNKHFPPEFKSFITKRFPTKTPKENYIQKYQMPARLNQTNSHPREYTKVGYIGNPSTLENPRNTPKFIQENVTIRICSPKYEEKRQKNVPIVFKQFKKIKPIMKATNFFSNETSLTNIELDNSTKYTSNQTTKVSKIQNHEQKTDKQNLGGIHSLNQFKIETQRKFLFSNSYQQPLNPAKSNIKGQKRRIQDFLTTKQQTKSIRDSDELSEHQRSQIITSYRQIMSQHGKFHLDN